MIWHSPIWFLVIPIIIGCFFIVGKKGSLQFSYIGASPKSLVSKFPGFLKFLSLIFLVLALARPKVVDNDYKDDILGIDIIFALDISASMLARDMGASNRLEAAKTTIANFINNRTSDRMGLLLFAAESFTEVPATTDYSLLLNKLYLVETDDFIKAGTAIGVAVANSVARLKFSDAKTKVIILLTDGENNAGTIDPVLALDIAKKHNVKIYTIGIGTEGMATIPIIQKNPITNKSYKLYTTIYTKVNTELLKKLAKETDGKFYRAIDEESLSDIFSEIDSLEKTKISTSTMTKYKELFYIPLVIGFVLFSISLILKHSILRLWP